MSNDEMGGELSPENLTDTEIETSDDRLTVRRTFAATPERLFRAFTDPDELAAWYAPGEMTAEVGALEAEPDGELSVTMRAGEEVHAVEGTFLEVVENERLVHTWEWQQGPFDESSLVTVEFEAVDGGTEVVLTHERLDGTESVTEHANGWVGIFENLADHL